MATKRSTGRKSNSGQRRTSKSAHEPVAARALQSLILIAGVGLLLAVFFGGRWGPAVVGVLVLVSAFPPMRRPVDRWLVGKVRGDEADQAALIRIVAGAAIVLFALFNPLGL
ncbi:MAG TPA: hypothetical protein ENI95_13215 [Chloroflexi bacterium]|nr:hypothetical protein [Chloroflexota bacterium]